MVKLFSCKAHDGDYFWLRYKHDAEELYHNLVIDGGRKSNASDFCEMLKRIYENGEKIDAMVLTHFDQDHIMGMLAGLQKAQKKNCIPEIEALYFNTGEGYWKQIVFTFDRLNLMHLVLGLFAFWMGLRDLLGKDPLIHTFFNQYDRDPEYRAMWQKKNGVLFMCNAVIFFALLLLDPATLLHRVLSIIWIVADLIYLVVYESWNHSAD